MVGRSVVPITVDGWLSPSSIRASKLVQVVLVFVDRAGRYSCRWSVNSSPLPQLLPQLNEGLDLARAGKVVVDQAAVTVRLLVEVANCRQAQMCEVVTDFLEIVLAQHLRFALVGTQGHAGAFYSFRFSFVIPLDGQLTSG
jgi:hypothetical protein